MSARRSLLASALCIAVAGCASNTSRDMNTAPAGTSLITAIQAREAADRTEGGSWHPARVIVAFRDDYRLRPGTPKRPVWVVSYIGGDVCIPAHGGVGSVPCADRENVLVDAHTGKFIAASAVLEPGA